MTVSSTLADGMLPRTPRPRPTQSFPGFLLEASSINGYRDPWWILYLAGMPRKFLMQPGMPTESISEMLGGYTADLERISNGVPGEPGQFKILSHHLGSETTGVLRLRNPAFCPLCVQEQGYLDAFWDLRVAVACPEHGMPVLRTCVRCRKPVSWRRPELLECACGAHFKEAPGKAPSAELREMLGMIKAKLHGKPISELPNRAAFPMQVMERMELAPLLQVLEILGAHSLGLVGSEGPKVDDRIFSEAAKVLAQWPKGFHQLLLKLDAQGQRKAKEGIRTLNPVKRLYGALFTQSTRIADAAVDFRGEFIEFGRALWGHGAKARSTRRKPVDGQENPAEAASERPAPRKDNPNLIRRAAAILGLPVRVIRTLDEWGVLPSRGQSSTAWPMSRVKAVLAQAKALVVKGAQHARAVPLSEVLTLRFSSHRAKSELVRAVFDRTLEVSGQAGDSVGSLVLDAEAVEAKVQQLRMEVHKGTYSLRDTSRLTGIDPACVRSAAAMGLLQEVTSIGRPRIPVDSVARFNSTYIKLSGVPETQGMNVRRLKLVCEATGIELFEVQRPNNASSQPFILRTAIPQLVLAVDTQNAKASRAQPRDLGEENLQRLARYLEDLRLTGGQLPRRGGRANKAQIARKCGFDRSAFETYPAVGRMLKEYSAEEALKLGIIEEPLDRLKAYFAGLRDAKADLPRVGGFPNLKVIAASSGVDRNIFYCEKRASDLLRQFDRETDDYLGRNTSAV